MAKQFGIPPHQFIKTITAEELMVYATIEKMDAADRADIREGRQKDRDQSPEEMLAFLDGK